MCGFRQVWDGLSDERAKNLSIRSYERFWPTDGAMTGFSDAGLLDRPKLVQNRSVAVLNSRGDESRGFSPDIPRSDRYNPW